MGLSAPEAIVFDLFLQHLAAEAERFCRLHGIALMLLQDGGDVFALERQTGLLQAASTFKALVKKAVSTPPTELKKRDEQWRKERKRAKIKG